MDTLALYPHQREAVGMCQRYFEHGSSRAALVHMPTGTGKTGVIAVIASERCSDAPVLVVCPSSALVEQLSHDIGTGFWDTISAPASWRPKQIHKLLPTTLRSIATATSVRSDRHVLVGTIQALQQIHAAGQLDALNGLVGTVIFDEGHREPAPSWAEVVRGLAVPTILFSATPFRSDLKIFDVDEDYLFFLSFEESVAKALIRGIEIDVRDLSLQHERFAREIVAARDDMIRSGRFDGSCKVIVRAASETDVQELFDAFLLALAGRTDGVLALHENFKPTNYDGGKLQADVPRDLRSRSERFLIHQFKLTEGIDDPSITMLALFDTFTNERQLVQQFGRLLRHPGKRGDAVEPAVVLARTGDDVDQMWSRFLSYDRTCIANGGKPPLRNSLKIYEDMVSALPGMDYIGGRFRTRVSLESGDLEEDLQFPRSCTVFEAESGLDLDVLAVAIKDLLEVEDRQETQHGSVDGGACHFHVTLRLAQSPFLSTYLFQALALEVTIYARHGSRLYFYDSAGLAVDDLDGIGARLDPAKLQCLLWQGDDNTISALYVKNTDLGPFAVRGRSMTSRSLERSGTFVGEHLNVVTRATGRIDNVRRTVSLARGRVRDAEGAVLTAAEFSRWCALVGDELDAARDPSGILTRFAMPTAAPGDTTPSNILVDMVELSGEFRGASDQTAQFDLESLCVDVLADASPTAPAPYRFQIVIDGLQIDVWINWDRKKKKYWLKSPKLSTFKAKDNPRVSLTRRLNQAQPFRIITGGNEHVYVHGSFYALDLNLANPNGAGRLVLDLVTPLSGLGAITSEKGKADGAMATWQAGSLFEFIDRSLGQTAGAPVFGAAFDGLVCDDLGAEVADFIGVARATTALPARVVFIVAKHAAGEPSVSASSFFDVCGQALKNLAYLKSDGVELPGSRTKWDNDWRMSHKDGAGVSHSGTVARLRYGPTSRPFRRLINELRQAPATNREIWLVCAGGMLSKTRLKQEFSETPPKAHVLQFYHLVISAFAACQSVGVGLKIFSAD